MHNVNWWLMALAFLLGLVLTLFLLIGRVKREVPEYATLGRRECRREVPVAATSTAYGAGSIRVKGTATAPDGGLHREGQRGLDALSHVRQPVVEADDRRGLVP